MPQCRLHLFRAPLSLTLFAAQTAFTDAGELTLFIDESQLTFRDQALTASELGQLLWAAQASPGTMGVALYHQRARYLLELYVIIRNVAVLTPGVYHYLVGRHELVLTTPATTMVGAFSDDDIGRLLCLKPNQIPLCLVSVGAP